MLTIHYPKVNKYCADCFRLLCNDIYIRLVNDFAWWTRCMDCRGYDWK